MKYFIGFIALFLIVSCKPKVNAPDVGKIAVSLTVHRFEQDLFGMDTTNIQNSLQAIYQKHPVFFKDYIGNIMALPQNADTAALLLKSFLQAYKPIYDTTQIIYKNFGPYEKEIKQGLQFFKYYFPAYELPQHLYTFIGPMDAYFTGSIGAYGDVLTQAGPAIGLQMHMGNNATAYSTGMQQGYLYDYQVRRFTPQTIAVNCIKNIMDDAYPYTFGGRPLIEEIIEKGKRMYVLNKLMPYTPDSLKYGYTTGQMAGCIENENLVWNYFVKNNLLYETENTITRTYIEDGPKTQELGDGAPGYVGLFVGNKIVEKYMSKNVSLSMDALMKTPAMKIFNEAKYKP
jgi:hypothetical protein